VRLGQAARVAKYAGGQRQHKQRRDGVTPPPADASDEGRRHQKRAEGGAHAPTRVQPVHLARPVPIGHVDIQAGVDQPGAQAARYTQGQQHPPAGRDSGAGQVERQATKSGRQQHAQVPTRQGSATDEAADQVAD
jgi:hypothetical protein